MKSKPTIFSDALFWLGAVTCLALAFLVITFLAKPARADTTDPIFQPMKCAELGDHGTYTEEHVCRNTGQTCYFWPVRHESLCQPNKKPVLCGLDNEGNPVCFEQEVNHG